jgi:uncharacterized surface protein with fasciclin (FAS1) repeats
MENNNKTNWLLMGLVGFVILAVVGLLIMNNQGSDTTQQTNDTEQTEQVNQQEVQNSKEETSNEESSQGENMTEPTQNIVEIASGNENFKTLVQAVTAANLVETLSGEGPFTVFAPTDEAFAKLPEGTIENLLANPEELTKVLTYHVVAGKVMAEDVVKLTNAATVQGQNVTIKVEGDKVMINDSTVTSTDIEATNGVIHVIDTVLLPQ